MWKAQLPINLPGGVSGNVIFGCHAAGGNIVLQSPLLSHHGTPTPDFNPHTPGVTPSGGI